MVVEAKIIEFLQSNASVGWITFFEIITGLASFVGLIIFALIIFCKNKKLSLFYMLSFGFVALFNLAVKHIIKRPRPFDKYSFILNLGNENGYSMPSSHSAIAGMTAVFICYFAFKCSHSKLIRALTIICMSLFVCLICLSRMVLGVHYLTDTLAGVAEGVIIGLLAIKAYSGLEKSLNNKPTH